MAGPTSKKRTHHESAPKIKPQRPTKKQKKQALAAYHSDSEEDESFQPVNLMDSDDDAGLDATVDDGASSDSGSGSEPQADSESEDEETSARQKLTNKTDAPKEAKRKLAQDAPPSSGDEEDDSDDDSERDEFDLDGDSDADSNPNLIKVRSKRNDAAAFSTSMQKILGTKLATSRRADPVLSRSADAHQASKEIVDAALDAKARRAMRQKKLEALEKGRVRDVLLASSNPATGEVTQTTSEIMEEEKRLRKVAQRGVVKLFNAVRAAQVRGQEAESEARREGFVGVEGRKKDVSEMSRKGFLDLIAGGGGDMKKGRIEEA